MVQDHSGIEAHARLESLIGDLGDLLMPARHLVGELRVRANASHTTREQLAQLQHMVGSLWERLGVIHEEASQLRASMASEEERPDDPPSAR